jgi:hypothetical protein
MLEFGKLAFANSHAISFDMRRQWCLVVALDIVTVDLDIADRPAIATDTTQTAISGSCTGLLIV